MSIITKTITPDLCDLNLANSKNILEKYSNYLDLFSNFIDQIETALEYRTTYHTNDTVKERTDFFNSLSTKIENFDTEFVAYWYEKANTAPEYIKEKINVESLKIKSDSIGKFSNARYVLDDSTQNVQDFMGNSQQMPDYLPYNAYNKVSPWTYKMLTIASFRTNSMFRSSISTVQSRNYDSKSAHGVNLVTDSYHFSRTENEYAESYFNQIKQKFKNEIKILAYFCNLYDNKAYNAQDTTKSNLQKIVEYENIEIDIEQIKTKVDLLNNKIMFIKQKVLNDDVLSTEKIETIQQNAYTPEQIDQITRSGNLLTSLTNMSISSITKRLSKKENESLTTSAEFSKQTNIDKAKSEKTNDQVANDLEKDAPSYSSAKFYPSNASNPTYQPPEWAAGIYDCLGIGSIVGLFNGIDDPFNNLDNILDLDFDFYSVLEAVNPFNTQFLQQLGIDLTSIIPFDLRFLKNFDLDQQLNTLMNTIQNFDVTSIFSAFSLNLPIPSFSLGTLFDLTNNFDDIIKNLSDRVLDEITDAIIGFLEGVVCSGQFNAPGIPSVGSLTFSG